MADSISQNTVEVDVQVNNKDALTQLTEDMNGLKKAFGAGVDDPFDDIAKTAKEAKGDVDKLTGGVKKTAEALGGGEAKATSFMGKLKEVKKISFDKLKSGASAFAVKLKEAANVSFDKLKSGLKSVSSMLGSGIAKAAKFTAKGIAAASAGIGALTGLAINSYGDYEQLKGGVETLFGAGGLGIEDYAKKVGKSADAVKGEYNGLIASQENVLKNANDAYKTAGLSANEYMQNVIMFSASLKRSFDETPEGLKAAGEAANDAIVAMADNANKMGTPMETIQNAYQGFAKQQYELLDNLALGYSGSKAGMEHLLKDAQKITGVKYDINNLADVFSAIRVIQDELGITNTTVNEAEKTIQGSFAAMKSSWKNLMTAFVAGGDSLDQCIDNMIESVGIFGRNIMPAVEKALGGIGSFMEKAAPIIADKLPGIAEELIPPLVKAATSVVAGLIRALPTIISSLISEIPNIVSSITQAISDSLGDSHPILKGFAELFGKCGGSIAKATPYIIGAVVAFKAFGAVKGAASGIMAFMKPITQLKDKLGGMDGKLKDIADGTKAAGNAASGSASGMLSSAKAFALMGLGVLEIAAGFALLTYSAVQLANAGPLAIGVMFGLVAALTAIGIGMMIMLKTLSTLGAGAIQGAAAMVILGAAIILTAAGFALLAFSAIQLASAGPLAIGVMLGLVVAVIAIMAVAAMLGPALTAGAVGFIAFGAAMLLAGAGAVLFAEAIKIMTPPLTELVAVVGSVVDTIVNSIGNILVNCIRAAGEVISGILDGIANIFLKFGEGVKAIIEGIGNAVSSVLDAVAGIFDSIGNAAKNAGLGFESVARGLRIISELSIRDLIKSIGAVGEGMSAIAKHSEGMSLAAQGMQMLVMALMNITGVTEPIMLLCTMLPMLLESMNNLPGAFEAIGAPTAQLVAATAPLASVFTALALSSAILADAITAISTGMSVTVAVIQTLSAVTNTVFATMENVVKTSCSKIVNIVKNCANNIKSAFSSIKLNSTGMNIMQGLINGMDSKRSIVISKARSIAQAISREMNNALDIQSPSKVTMETGKFAAQGLVVGLQKELPRVEYTSRNTAGAVSGSIESELRAYSLDAGSSATRTTYGGDTTIAPVFQLTVQGGTTVDERQMARRVRGWVREEFENVLDSMSRRNPRTQSI